MGDRQNQSTEGSHPSTREVDGADDLERVVDAEGQVIVDFYADWCGPCTMMAPVLEEFAGESEASVVKVDVEAHPHLAHEYDVSSIPTILAFVDGELVDRLIGVQDKETLAEAVA